MSGEHHSLCHKGVQVFPNKYNAVALPGDNKLPSSPSAASRPFCWLPFTVHCLTKARGIHELHIKGRSSLCGSKLVPLNKRVSLVQSTSDFPLSLTLSWSLHGAVFGATPLAAFLREFPCMELRGLGREALLTPCFCG